MNWAGLAAIPLLFLVGCDAGFDCEDPESSGWSSAAEPDERDMLDEVNARRAAGATCNGVAMPAVGPVTMNEELRCAARRHAVDLGVRDYFAHESPGGVTPAERAEDAGYDWSRISENIAGGRDSAELTVEDLIGSTTGHCENIMDAEVFDVGMGVATTEDSELGTYWVQVFGAQR